MTLIYILLTGAVCGWLAGEIWKDSGFGLIGNMIVGILGSIFGGWMAVRLGIGSGALLWQILISVGGGWILLFLISLIKKA
ncbi:hypothetical protein ASE21_20490 [Flavobacterium sp. Root901]|uniref:GlsB/YeaQ/YmgE family stress response membrane protein n=1 Tax=Flavobacterium sp. Root901 TaxID=1736605 RepID=UPI0007103381|nr:GlsB/YeaQ/YmgE family stress response membrane protein [Flavobacterium sp. Root901]KRD06571.1 hypothetical protein ASE21_20490 [Flavobacterium sp. Root901]